MKNKTKPSGSAIFMYLIIGITCVISTVTFTLYYCGFTSSLIIKWIGIVAFIIMYHLWMRIIMGNVNKLFKINYKKWWFKEKSFEKKLYKLLKVKKWKGKALTYNPQLYSVKDRTLEDIANTTAKSETDHLVNVLISLSTLLFSLLWDAFWILLVTAILAIAFDMQFVIIQRYNRPRIIRLINRTKDTQKTV